MKIAVNAGHCPDKVDGVMLDSGACGKYSTEAEIVRCVANVVCDALEAVGIEADFIQVNELQEICDISNENNADLFVSIHCNSCDSEIAEGTETFYAYGSERGYELAKCIQHQLLSTMHSVNRGVKADTCLYDSGLYVLRHTEAPAALAELDFISNTKREDYMNTHCEEMGKAIARAITDYIEGQADEDGVY